MEKTRKKLGLGFKVFLGLTILNLVVFVAMFVFFGLFASKTADADIKGGIGDVLKYHFSDLEGLLTFKFHDGSNIIYVLLSGILYFFAFVALLYLIAGIVLMAKRKRPVILVGILASILVVGVYLFMATGLPKYWAIVNQRGAFENNNDLLVPTFLLLIFGALYILTAYILYFVTIFNAIKVNNDAKEEAPASENNEEHNLENEEVVEFEEIDPAIFENKETEKTNNQFDKNELKELIRDIVREELARNNANNAKNNPYIVQYFNGVQAETIPAPKEEEPLPEPEKEEEPLPEPAKQEEVVVVNKPAPAPRKEVENDEKKPIIRIPFTERMLNASKEMQDNYNELKNEILSYGVNSRVSNSGDTFRLHRKTYIKITIAGFSLKLYFALNPEDYKDTTLPIQDAGHKGIYEEIPLVFKVKSGLSMRRCKQLIQDVFDKNGLEQKEIGNTNWVEELKNIVSTED